MLYHRRYLIACAGLLATAASAQGVALQAAVAPDGAGHAHVTLSNGYTAAARTFLVSCQSGSSSAVLAALDFQVFRDGIGGPLAEIAPGASERLPCPLDTVAVRVLAVIYDDGHGEGDAASLTLLAQARVAEAAEAAQALQLLGQASAAAAAGTPQNAQRLAAQLGSIAAQFPPPAGLGTQARDAVCLPIARGLLAGGVRTLPQRLADWTAILGAFSASLARTPPSEAQ